MKICVTAQGNNLDAEVDPRFGRCRFFLIVDTETLAYEAIGNPHLESAGGAGVQSGQLVAGKGVTAVLTGNIGPNAFAVLQTAGIAVVTGVSGPAKAAIEDYKSGKLNPGTGPSVGSKFGMPGK